MNSPAKLPASVAAEVRDAVQVVSTSAGRSLSFNALVTKWSELTRDVENGYQLTVYDYTNDLSSRDRLEEILTTLTDTARAAVASLVQPIDERFIAATDPIARPLLNKPYLWWRRIPRKRTVDFGLIPT